MAFGNIITQWTSHVPTVLPKQKLVKWQKCKTALFDLTKKVVTSNTAGLKAFLSLSFPRVILGNFGKKPFLEFLKAFQDLEKN